MGGQEAHFFVGQVRVVQRAPVAAPARHLRQAFCADGQEPLGMFFGATCGDMYGTADGGSDLERGGSPPAAGALGADGPDRVTPAATAGPSSKSGELSLEKLLGLSGRWAPTR